MSQNFQDRQKQQFQNQLALQQSLVPTNNGQSFLLKVNLTMADDNKIKQEQETTVKSNQLEQAALDNNTRPVLFQPNQIQLKHQFTIDRQEYQSVFRMFDKDNSGVISIDQVNHYIHKFDQMHAQSFQNVEKGDSAAINGQFKRQATNTKQNKVQLGGAQLTYLSNQQSGPNSRLTKQPTQQLGAMPTSNKQQSNSVAKKSSLPQANVLSQQNNQTSLNGTSNKVGAQQQQPNITSFGVTPTSNTKQPQINPAIKTTTGNKGTNNQTERNQQQINSSDFNGSTSNVTTSATAVSTSKPGRALLNYQNNSIINGGPLPANAQNGKQLGISPQKKLSNAGTNANVVMQLKLTQIDSFSSGAQHQNNGVTNNSQNNSEENNGESGGGTRQQPNRSFKNSTSGFSQLKNNQLVSQFPNGKQTLQFDEFIEVIRESCTDTQTAENYLVFAFSMFDRQKKGYITSEDLKIVFQLLGNEVTDEELKTMVKIAGVKSNDKINFKEFVDFFYKAD